MTWNKLKELAWLCQKITQAASLPVSLICTQLNGKNMHCRHLMFSVSTSSPGFLNVKFAKSAVFPFPEGNKEVSNYDKHFRGHLSNEK